MKKKYVNPEIEIKSFHTEDIITASSPAMNTISSVDADNGNVLEFDCNNFE